MNIENWNFQEYQKEKKEYEKQKQAERLKREKEANMDTYFVEYLLNGKEHLYTFKSDKSEEAVRGYVSEYMKGEAPAGTYYSFWKKGSEKSREVET
jgi:hypothetical protein